MRSLADYTGRPIIVQLMDGHRFAAKLLSVRGGQATFQSRTGWRSTHCLEDIRFWKPAIRRRRQAHD